MKQDIAQRRGTVRLQALVFALTALAATQVWGAAWVSGGDRGLRSDIEILAAHDLIDNLVTTWPIPAGQLRVLTDTVRLEREPEYVRRAAQRVMAQLNGPWGVGDVTGVVEARVTNAPDLIHDFDSTARNQADLRAGLDWNGDSAGASLRVGVQSRANGDGRKASLDGSFASAVLGNVRVYGGWLDQWYGPGWDSSLILSNNARPFPKIGLMRENPTAFETPWLSWIGPWQANFFVGLLDGPRVATNTAFSSLRLTFAPIHGLEIALTRLTEFCGKGHPCRPVSALFHVRNDPDSVNETNDEASIEFKGTLNFDALTVSPYAQFMNEDTGPFTHSVTSYLGGFSFAGPYGFDGAHWRLTAEYSDSVPTLNWFDFSNLVHGSAYNNGDYVDGYRYRDRTLGFSLDSDSRLLSLIGQVTDNQGWTYRAVYRNASISTPQLAAMQAAGSAAVNVVSSSAVKLNQGELGLSIPTRWLTLDFAVRGQSGLPVPVSGSAGDRLGAELGVIYKF